MKIQLIIDTAAILTCFRRDVGISESMVSKQMLVRPQGLGSRLLLDLHDLRSAVTALSDIAQKYL